MNQLVELPKTSSELIAIDPPTYVATAYEPFIARFAAAVTQFGGVKYDIATKPGMETAKAARAAFRDIRTGTEKKRAECKAPILEIGKLLDSRAKEITAQIEPHESRFDADIKAEEKRLDDERAAKIKAEAERNAAIHAKIDNIKSKPLAAINKSSGETRELIEQLLLVVPNEENFAERFVEAEIALKTSIEQLNQMVAGKLAQEQLASQQEDQRLENERLARIAAEEKAAAETRQREEQEAQARIMAQTAAALKAGQEALARQQAELDKQKAEIEAQKQAAAQKTIEEAAAKAKAEQDAAAEQARKDETTTAIPVAPVRTIDTPTKPVDKSAEIVHIGQSAKRPSDTDIIRAIIKEFGCTNGQACDWIIEMADNMKQAALTKAVRLKL